MEKPTWGRTETSHQIARHVREILWNQVLQHQSSLWKTATSGDTPSQHPRLTHSQMCDPQKLGEIINNYCWRSSSLGVICYIARDNEFTSQISCPNKEFPPLKASLPLSGTNTYPAFQVKKKTWETSLNPLFSSQPTCSPMVNPVGFASKLYPESYHFPPCPPLSSQPSHHNRSA